MRYAQPAPNVLRAVLDSSVLVSAFLTPHGAIPVHSRYQLCLSEAILADMAEVLLGKSRLRRYAASADADVHDYIRWLLTQAAMLTDHAPAPRCLRPESRHHRRRGCGEDRLPHHR